jgi:hypothetical protein
VIDSHDVTFSELRRMAQALRAYVGRRSLPVTLRLEPGKRLKPRAKA